MLAPSLVARNDTMKTEASLAVTLSAELFDRLSAEARLLGLPLEWVIASLVADTVDDEAESEAERLALAYAFA